jgi:hypothetical protein
VPIATVDTYQGKKSAKERAAHARRMAKHQQRLAKKLERQAAHLGHSSPVDPTVGD